MFFLETRTLNDYQEDNTRVSHVLQTSRPAVLVEDGRDAFALLSIPRLTISPHFVRICGPGISLNVAMYYSLGT